MPEEPKQKSVTRLEYPLTRWIDEHAALLEMGPRWAELTMMAQTRKQQAQKVILLIEEEIRKRSAQRTNLRASYSLVTNDHRADTPSSTAKRKKADISKVGAANATVQSCLAAPAFFQYHPQAARQIFGANPPLVLKILTMHPDTAPARPFTDSSMRGHHGFAA